VSLHYLVKYKFIKNEKAFFWTKKILQTKITLSDPTTLYTVLDPSRWISGVLNGVLASC